MQYITYDNKHLSSVYSTLCSPPIVSKYQIKKNIQFNKIYKKLYFKNKIRASLNLTQFSSNKRARKWSVRYRK